MKTKYRSIAAYIRVSSDKQDVSRQRDSVNRMAVRFSVTIALWFEDAIGKNPRDQPHKREGFKRLLQAVEAGLVDCIIVDSQDRFGTRDAYQWGSFLTTLRDHGCALLDATGKDLSADDDVSVLTGTLGAITSSREQREKAHRNISGKIPKAKRGEYQGGYPPYGLDVVCFGDKEKWRTIYVGHYDRWKVYPNGERESFTGKDNAPAKDPSDVLRLQPTIEKHRLEVVRQIFRWYATELISPRQIATKLRDAKVDPIFGEWDKVKIRQMLANPAYIGLPTWNKRAGSRFVEFVGGDVRDVAKTNGKPKQARPREQADFVQPEKPLYKPIINEATWNKVQAKLQESSDEQRSIAKRTPKTAELWLKPFLVCGHCNKPMRATRGESPGTKSRLWPSYFCGTYGTYGVNNPTGCHCHRVRHTVIEAAVAQYLSETAPKVANLLEATETGNLKLARPLLEHLAIARNDRGGVWLDMLAFVDEKGTAKERSKDLDEAYSVIYERMRPKLEAEIKSKERELDKMLDDYRTLSPKLRERANERMEAVQGELDALKKDTADLRTPWTNLKAEVAGRQQTVDKAIQVLGNGAAGRQKAETLSRVVDRIICHFRHTTTKDRKNNGKSFLDRVEIVPVAGDIVCFTSGNKPGQG